MISIRKKLLTSILLVVSGVTLLLAVITYFSIREEMDEFYDQNLREVAHTILATSPTKRSSLADKIEIDHKLKGEEEYLTQIWNKNALQYSSHPYVEFPLQQIDGTGRVPFENSQWRYYRKSQGDIVVQLAQDLKERHTVVIEIYGFLLIPILIQFPILAGLIWVMIGYSLRPLQDISNLIRNRNSSFLKPISGEGIPVEINVLVQELNNLLSHLEQALEHQGQFVADAAHELRTPLTAIKLQLNVLRRADNEIESIEAMDTLEKGVLRSTRLVQQLLELARQEPEKIEVEFSMIDLSGVIGECIEQVMPMARSKEISVASRILSHQLIKGNIAKLSVMIGNLITNAILYTNEKGRVEVTLRADLGKVILEVSDNGIGISAEDRKRIFDRFYRVAGTGEIGSGLGLSIVQSIANQHNATIDITDGIDGAGTSFRVSFKVA